MKLSDSKEELIFKDLVREPKDYSYVERGLNFFQVTDKDGDSFKIMVKKVVPKKSKNRPKGWNPESLSDII